MSGTWSKITFFAAHIKLAYSFHIRIFSSCALDVSDITAAIKLSLGYVTVATVFVGAENAVLLDCVAYTLNCDEIYI